MPKRHILLEDESSFTATTADMTIHRPAYIHQLVLSERCQSSAGANVTWAALLDLVNPLTLKLNGVPFCDIRGSDLFALDNLVFGQKAIGFDSGAITDRYGRVMGLTIPIGLPTGPETLTYKAAYAAVSGADRTAITLEVVYADVAIYPSMYRITTYDFTPPSTGALNKAIATTTKGPLEGILFYAYNIPAAATNYKGVDKVEVRVGGIVQISTNWEALRAANQCGSVADLAAAEGVLDNYAWLDLRGDPIAAGADVDVFINSNYIAANNLVRLIPVERA